MEGCSCCSFAPSGALVLAGSAVGRSQRRIDNRSQDNFDLKAAACSLDPVEDRAASLGAGRRFNVCTPPAGQLGSPPSQFAASNTHLRPTTLGISDSQCTHGWRETGKTGNCLLKQAAGLSSYPRQRPGPAPGFFLFKASFPASAARTCRFCKAARRHLVCLAEDNAAKGQR